MPATRHIALTIAAAILAGSEARSEDVFALIEPEAFAAANAPPKQAGFLRLAQAFDAPLLSPAVGPAEPVAPAEEVRRPAAAVEAPIGSISLDAAPDPRLVEQMAKLPASFAIRNEAEERFGSWESDRADATCLGPRFAPQWFAYAAPAVYSRPLYFEQPNVERYGHHVRICERDNLSQSAVSVAHFFGSAAVVPYMIGANPPDQCNYVLGAYRPGSCNPHQLTWLEPSLRGMAAQAAAVSGLIFLIP